MTEYLRIESDFEPEIVEDRIVWLSDEQFDLVDDLFEKLRLPGPFEFHIVVGVAGTGKTQVLLSLANDLRTDGLSVVSKFPRELRVELKKAGFQLSSDKEAIGAVHLYDDPIRLSNIKLAYNNALETGARALVVAVDPFQWAERKSILKFTNYLDPQMSDPGFIESHATLERFRDIAYGIQPEIHWLRSVYRQAGHTGLAALELSRHIFDNTNPFVSDSKVSEYEKFVQPVVKHVLDNINFVFQGGEFDVIETREPIPEISKLVRRNLNRPDRWSWTNSLLFVLPGTAPDPSEEESSLPTIKEHEPNLDFPSLGIPELNLPLSSYGMDLVYFEDPNRVRGKEYQEVIVVLTEQLWKIMTSKNVGLSSIEWKKIMPLHTFITRAKDNVCLIIVKGDALIQED
jgi:hypothetical protein